MTNNIFIENNDKLQFDNYLQYKMKRDQNDENFNSKVIDLSNSNFIPPVLKLKDVQEILKKNEIHISPNQMEKLIQYLILNNRKNDTKKFRYKLKKRNG